MQTTNILIDFIIPSDATLIEAIAKISKNSSRAVLVISGKKIVGVISEGDVLRAILNGSDIHSPLMGHINPSYKYLNNMDDQSCLDLIQRFGVTLIPIVDSNFKLLDVVTMADVLKKVSISK